ncbi:DUF262 domain-containing protein [Sphingomonas sp. PP-CE-1G-424]|uniref:DUF262 domain-containing protein n=1 Tax=Sphingomonas sp. PP-CE-1G-424 TaxID=2135658 RepID=UPI0010554338|nr:DUF262 domain-containing protein [Sphingomonas sp. PP-CE-1G-424]TCP65368.1 uncharacterized protein DUF262 [Sphingomonas sp. PP-CE-1G-424]
MIIEQQIARNDALHERRDTIQLNPSWQRGAAWKSPRQVLLVDSVLRGMDIPKVYLRRMPPGGVFEHEAVDGQQRLRALWLFRNDELVLDHPERLLPINGETVDGLTYSELSDTLKERFDAFPVSVADIVEGTADEVTNLFARLQMGVALNPAELRNAMLKPMRHIIDGVATSHEFFLNCRIADNRYRRQDFVTHLFALAAYRGERDIKAPDLKRMVADFGPDHMDRILECAAEVGDALNILEQVNELSRFRIVQKWIFVDLGWLVMQRLAAGASVDAARLAAAYHGFEARRALHNRAPDVLIQDGRANPVLDRHLYNYIQAFRIQAGRRDSVAARAAALRAFCPDIDARSE